MSHSHFQAKSFKKIDINTDLFGSNSWKQESSLSHAILLGIHHGQHPSTGHQKARYYQVSEGYWCQENSREWARCRGQCSNLGYEPLQYPQLDLNIRNLWINLKKEVSIIAHCHVILDTNIIKKSVSIPFLFHQTILLSNIDHITSLEWWMQHKNANSSFPWQVMDDSCTETTTLSRLLLL